MNILLIDPIPDLENAFKDAGHSVKTLRLNGGVFYLPALFDGFQPDLLLQSEWLATRSFLGGLQHVSCPTLFWALDSHLNLYWQRWYGQLFDAVLSPHVSLFNALPPLCRPARLERFAWFGSRETWRPHAQRRHSLSFCGRVDKHRRIRAWLIELLGPEGLHHVQNIDFKDMMRLYGETRITPNESIANETNFRLLEAASAGCLVLSPDVGEDQNALLEPDTEFLIYRDGLELRDQARWAMRQPEAAERMGLAAMRRIQAEHLPEHRAAFVLDVASQLGQGRLTGQEAALAFWLTLAGQLRNGTLPLDAVAHATEGAKLLAVLGDIRALAGKQQFMAANVLSQLICLYAESGNSGDTEKALELCTRLLAHNAEAAKESAADNRAIALEAGASACALAIREGRLDLARNLRLIYAPDRHSPPAADATGLCLEWSADLQAGGLRFWTGFGYVPEKGMLPDDALSWLFFARALPSGAGFPLFRRMEALLQDMPALLYLYLGTLAEHSLLEEHNWRLQWDYGLAALRACRVDEGLHDMREAVKKAEAEGQARAMSIRIKSLRQGLRQALEGMEASCP